MGQAAVILGMHRSGTSLVAKILHEMGFYFGEDSELMSAKVENPTGFWERHDVMDLNDRILTKVDASWVKVSGLVEMDISKEVGNEFDEEIKAIVESLELKSKKWCIKDPRLCLTWPVWKTYLEEPILVLVFRHPGEVGISLHTRNKFPQEFGQSLWHYYNTSIWLSLNKTPFLLVNYDELVKNPKNEIDRLYQEISKLGGDPRKIEDEEIENLVSLDLHRSKVSEGVLVPNDCLKLYEGLRNGEREIGDLGFSPEMMQTIKSLESIVQSAVLYQGILRFVMNGKKEMSPLELLRLERESDRKILKLKKDLGRKERELLKRQKIIDKDNALIQRQEEIISRNLENINRLQERIQNLAEAQHRLMAKVAKKQEKIERLKSRLFLNRLRKFLDH